jgi:hypothetical protein
MSALQLNTQLQRDLRKYVNMTSTCPLEHIELSVLLLCVSNLIKVPPLCRSYRYNHKFKKIFLKIINNHNEPEYKNVNMFSL